jgi:LysR family cyn operon transcriptional activator
LFCRLFDALEPTVSRQIRDLEDELGVQLFERMGKAVSRTEAGSLFLKEARAILERTDEAVLQGSSTSSIPIKLSNRANYGPTRLGPITDRPRRKFGNG